MSMQYQGSVVVAGIPLFVTGVTLNLAHDPIAPEIVWGGGWQVNYATGHFDPTFTVNFPWFQTYGSTLLTHCIDENITGTGQRNNPFTANVFNGGYNVAFTGVRCASINFSVDAMAAGAPVTCSATFASTGATVSSSNPGANTPPTNVDGQTPVPAYLMTAVGVINGVTVPSNKITQCTVDVNNNVFKLYTLNGSFLPADVQLGYLGVTGSFTYYSAGVSGVTDPTSGSFTLTGGGISWDIPSVLITGFNSDITGPNQKPMAAVQFRGFGDSSNPPVTVS